VKIELLRCLLDKGSIDDDTVIEIMIENPDGGLPYYAQIDGITIEHQGKGDLRKDAATKITLEAVILPIRCKNDEKNK